MTPEQFQAAAIGWVGAIVVVAGVVTVAVAKLSPFMAQVREAIESLKGRQQAQANRLDTQSANIATVSSDVTKVALATPSAAVEPPPEQRRAAQQFPVNINV
jgi:hypothetical protein